MKLTAKRVEELFFQCFREDGKTIEGILGHTKMDVTGHEDEIGELLAELPDSFVQSKGGGMSFLNACYDRHGNHWAEHRTMEWLFMLGIAANKAKWLFPRNMWAAFPGGMPYVVVLDGVGIEPKFDTHSEEL